MKVTARGPGYRSRISHPAYSTEGCHGSAGFGFNDSRTSSAVKPSPTRASAVGGEGARDLVGEVLGSGGKKAWIEASPRPAPPILKSNKGVELGMK